MQQVDYASISLLMIDITFHKAIIIFYFKQSITYKLIFNQIFGSLIWVVLS